MHRFKKDADYDASERVLIETLDRRPMRLCADCLMLAGHPHDP